MQTHQREEKQQQQQQQQQGMREQQQQQREIVRLCRAVQAGCHQQTCSSRGGAMTAGTPMSWSKALLEASAIDSMCSTQYAWYCMPA